ncbi:phage GP46 family protein [Acetobacter sp.]|uniref:phage GP46 family protein n=1 Tax=Acetobacter sp. TaxID=440 RepID=UPI0039E9ADCB
MLRTMTYVPYTNIAIGWSAAFGRCDVRVAAKGNGRGSVVIDRTPASTFLIGMGSYRRARADDRIPGTLNGVAPGGLLARRGWPGDALRSDGSQTGCRLWLLEDAKQTEATRQAAIQYLDETIGQIATDHGHDYSVSATWTARGRLQASASAFGTVVSTPVVIGDVA